jgi:hypothetical protein
MNPTNRVNNRSNSVALLFEGLSPTGSVFLIAIVVLSCLYIARRTKLATPGSKHDAERRPSTEPYTLPLLGSIPFSYVLRPYSFVLDPKYVRGLRG